MPGAEMRPAEVLETLMVAGAELKRALKKDGHTGEDWAALLESQSPNDLVKDASKLINDLPSGSLQATLEAVRAKQKEVKGTATLAEMSAEKLLLYSALNDLEMELATQQLQNTGLDAGFAKWLVDDALPVLMRAANVLLVVVR